MPARGAIPPREHPEHAPASLRRRRSPANWKQRARQYIRSIRSGISPRCSVGPGFYGFSVGWRKLKRAGRTRFQRTPFNQGVGPAPQCRNMNIDPIFPPVQRPGVVSKLGALFRYQGVRQFLYIVRRKIMLVQKNKWLEQFEELLQPFKSALRFFT